MEEITIVQHNVLSRTTIKANELTNIYQKINPDVILLNSTSKLENEKIKIYNYNVSQKNVRNEQHAGIAIAIKENLKYQILDDTNDDVLAVRIDTTRGAIIICTTYVPPRRTILPTQDLFKLIRKIFQYI